MIIARRDQTLGEVMEGVESHMLQIFNSKLETTEKHKYGLEMAQEAISMTIGILGDIWAGVYGPQLKDLPLEFVLDKLESDYLSQVS